MKQNMRILLVDDTASIHEDFRKILCARQVPAGLEEAESALFGSAARRPTCFEVESAFQGRQAVDMVQAALAAGRPHALAFVDMRMPPGWDGMETVERLWQLDPRLQVVICTAYSDHAWEEVLDRLGARDRLLVVKKPFDMIEVMQLAHALTAKWSLEREAEDRRLELEATVHRLSDSESKLRCTLHELDSFAHSLAHDLQAPLVRIASFAGLVAERLAGQGSREEHYVQRVQANASLGQDLVNGLRVLTDIARTEIDPAPVDISRMALQLLHDLQESEPQRRVEVRVAPGLAARGDRCLLRVALTNLIENAWKFSSRREVAEIEVGAAPWRPGEHAFFVRDNGCGFDMGQAGRLFQNFQRLHGPQEYPGTGVGLVTVSRVVTRHGGRVWAESVPDQGSSFYFTLPPACAAAAGA